MIHDGNELIRLDPATGAKLWSRPLGVEDLSERPEAMALDGDRVYWASGRTLNAAALADGELAWRRHLTGPESGWSIALTAALRRGLSPAPRGRRRRATSGFPLVFRRRDTGDLVQRLLVPSSVSEVAVRLALGASWSPPGGTSGRYGDRRTMDGAAPSR